MICPNCKAEITRVCVYFECWEYGFLEGNRITSYGSIEDVGEAAVAIVCEECDEDITDAIKKGGSHDGQT